jgi:hypothetical protein
MYHFASEPMRVHWKSRNLMESSINELDEQKRWKVIIWLFGSSLDQPSNLGMLDGNLDGMTSQ